MRINPRNAALALVTTSAILTGLTACGSHSPDPVSPPAPVEVDSHDCDYDDLLEGDSDCNGYLGREALKDYCKDKTKRAKLGRKCDPYVLSTKPTRTAHTRPAGALPRVITPTRSGATVTVPPLARPRTAAPVVIPVKPRTQAAVPVRPAPVKPVSKPRR